jgi:hypothetical protein
MSTEMKDLTPETTETEALQTSAAGTEPSQATQEQTPQSAPPADPTDYRKKFSESSAEALRLYQENQRLRAQLATPAQPAPPAKKGYDPAKLTDDVLDRNADGIRQFANTVIEEAEQRATTHIQQQNYNQQRISSALAYVQNEIRDPQSPIAQAATANYYRMLNDPINYSHIERFDMDVPGVGRVNPFLIKEAVLEAKADIGGKLTSADISARRTGDNNVEPASRPAPTQAAKFTPSKHLSEAEREYCTKANIAFDTYFKWLDDGLQRARLKEGRPITQRELR